MGQWMYVGNWHMAVRYYFWCAWGSDVGVHALVGLGHRCVCEGRTLRKCGGMMPRPMSSTSVAESGLRRKTWGLNGWSAQIITWLCGKEKGMGMGRERGGRDREEKGVQVRERVGGGDGEERKRGARGRERAAGESDVERMAARHLVRVAFEGWVRGREGREKERRECFLPRLGSVRGTS